MTTGESIVGLCCGVCSGTSQARTLDVDSDMQPVVEFLLSRGVPVGDVAKVNQWC